MFFRLFILIIPGILLASPHYQVKLAVYKNLHSLQKKIATLPPKLSKTIQIIQTKNVYKASTHPTKDKQTLKTLLPSYRKVFSDAFIGPVTITDSPSVVLARSQESHPVQTKAEKKLSFSRKFKQKTLYLSTKGSKPGATLLIKVVFTDDSVTYTPIIGKVPPVVAQYHIKGNKLYMYQKGLFNKNIYSILEKNYKKYYLLSSWVKDKKINDLRYYLTLKNAKQYLNKNH